MVSVFKICCGFIVKTWVELWNSKVKKYVSKDLKNYPHHHTTQILSPKYTYIDFAATNYILRVDFISYIYTIF